MLAGLSRGAAAPSSDAGARWGSQRPLSPGGPSVVAGGCPVVEAGGRADSAVPGRVGQPRRSPWKVYPRSVWCGRVPPRPFRRREQANGFGWCWGAVGLGVITSSELGEQPLLGMLGNVLCEGAEDLLGGGEILA